MYEKLEFLLALAREKHFGRAAQVCGVSQPNLSAAIKQLESILGVPLVDRGARFLGFTPEGERVLEWARRIVGDTRAMRAEVETMKQGLTGHLRLAVIPTALPVVSCLTAAFWKRHPGIKLTVSSHTSTEVLSMLDNLEADAGITYLDNEPLGRISEVPLYRERHHLVTAEGNPFFDRPTVSWEEVAGLPLCLLSPDMQNRRIIDRTFAEIGCRVDPLLETSSIVVIATHVRAGYWATIMPRLMAEEMCLPPHVRTIPLVAPEVANLVGLVVGHRDPQPPLTAALVAEARTLAPTLSSRS
ncbi:LysR family transcriptional regulator [Pinisolibacter aquiterrae]|uniref:LysR family transcriptional regulator n=1 Tax=Pinisolibacter aquiterrae TaxID=2815579 RepID=UPI001C3DBB27|nr:LysR family transcriptional regulator [Pinisolibacter aquiterrae]MBV5264556.1 LysR family transcriptional regulator [Pinisolibacter aquiterrae]MCC8233325.1 LysR family transcriptional regulator [Pinisolibacter aquiterrae]